MHKVTTVCQYSPTRHKSVTIARSFERSVAFEYTVTKPTNRSAFAECLVKKGKFLPYSLPSVGPGADFGVTYKQSAPAGDLKPSTRR